MRDLNEIDSQLQASLNVLYNINVYIEEALRKKLELLFFGLQGVVSTNQG
jgi:hypothetical protein